MGIKAVDRESSSLGDSLGSRTEPLGEAFETECARLLNKLNAQARGNPKDFVNHIDARFPTETMKRDGFTVLSVMSQFATMKGMEELKERVRELREDGYHIYLPRTSSVADSFRYLANIKKILGVPLSNHTSRGFITSIQQINANTVLIYDSVIKERLSTDEAFRKRVLEMRPKILVPLGLEGRISLFTPRDGEDDATKFAKMAEDTVRNYYERCSNGNKISIEGYVRSEMCASLGLKELPDDGGIEFRDKALKVLSDKIEIFEPFNTWEPGETAKDLFERMLTDDKVGFGSLEELRAALYGFSNSEAFNLKLKGGLNTADEERVRISLDYISSNSHVVSLPQFGKIGVELITKLQNFLRKIGREWDDVVFIVNDFKNSDGRIASDGFVTWGLRHVAPPQSITAANCKTFKEIYDDPKLYEKKVLVFLDDFCLSGDQMRSTLELFRAPRGLNSAKAVTGQDFQGTMILAPLVATKHAKILFKDCCKSSKGDTHFMPGKVVADVAATLFYKNLNGYERFIFEQLGSLGYQNLGLCIQSTVHSPNNNSQFWSKNFAPHMTFNGGGIAKSTRPKPKRAMMRKAMEEHNERKNREGL